LSVGLQELNYLLEKLTLEDDTLGEKEEVERDVLRLVIEASIRRVLDDMFTMKQVGGCGHGHRHFAQLH